MRELFPLVQSPALSAFASLAEEYCHLVDGHTGTQRNAFLQAMHGLLPRLYAAALALPPTSILFLGDDGDPDEEPVEEEHRPTDWTDGGHPDEWSALALSLASLIGDRDLYQEIFDPYEPANKGAVTGSLANDFADLYKYLRSGVRKWKRGESGDALWEWRFYLENYWGGHVLSALRALYELSSTYDFPWPQSDPGAA